MIHKLRPHVGTDYLLRIVNGAQRDRTQRKILAQEVVEQGAGNSRVKAVIRGALPGDRARLRGIPMFTEGGMSGTILGTQPEQAVMARD